MKCLLCFQIVSFTFWFFILDSESTFFSHFLRIEKSLKNQTIKNGLDVQLECQFSGHPSKIKVKWFKNNAPVEKTWSKFETKKKIKNKNLNTKIGIKFNLN